MTIAEPAFNNILVKRYEKPTMSKSGLYMPETTKTDVPEGIIVSVGKGLVQPDGFLTPMSAKVGDHVIYSKHAGTIIRIDGEELILILETDILCTLKEHNAR
jgi:chaperonin GroES